MNQQENREIRISPDALIALVVAEAEDRELSAMPSLEEMNAAFHPSEEFQKKMDRLLKQAKRKQERKGAWRATKRLFVVATTVVTACSSRPVFPMGAMKRQRPWRQPRLKGPTSPLFSWTA